jgi:hypothetical protein
MFDWMVFWWQARQFWTWLSYGGVTTQIAARNGRPGYPSGAVTMAYAVARSKPLHRVDP